MSINNRERTVRKYSDAFKRQVVEAIEEDGYTQGEAARRYGCARSSIHRWLKKYGKNHLLNKVVRIETMEETDRISELTEQINQLKQALADVHLDKQIAETYLDVACQRLDMSPQELKKKIEQS